MNPETHAYLAARRLHPTQRFQRRRNGRMVLSMTVRGTEELKNWILGFGSHLEVLQPAGLRDEVASAVDATAKLYASRPRAR